MTSENTFPDDLSFLTILDPINDFRNIAENYYGLNDFIKVATSLTESLNLAVKKSLRQKIEAMIVSEINKPVSDFEDYGVWRAKHNNANYSQYVNARNINASRITLLQKALDNLIWLENEAELILEQFSSIQELVYISNSLSNLVEELNSSIKIETQVSATIDEFDKSLCFEWSNEKFEVSSPTQSLSDVLGRYEAARLLSARAAEKATAHYYYSLGEEVVDVSATQIDSSDGQWKDFDLLVGGRPIDVKNARKSFSSPNTYVEHFIPRFKHDRKYNNEVSIVSVLSDYGFEDQICSGEFKYQILGEVNVSTIRKLYSCMQNRFGSLLNLDGLWRQGYAPGWMFEYPNLHYQHQRETLPQLAQMFNGIMQVCKYDGEVIPGWVLLLSTNYEGLNQIIVSEIKQKLLRDLFQLKTEVGFSRPSLFIYSMGVILESMLVNSSSDKTAKVLRELLFFDDETHPLFLLDTQEYVSNLIYLLSQLREEVYKSNIQFTGFKMPHPSILLGLREGFSPITLIAYCGGWREEPVHVKCGSAPLVFGEHQTCPSCNRLICNDCGYCKESCSKGLRIL